MAAWIEVSDGKVLITEQRLEAMYEGLPALKYVLEGHPKMKRQKTKRQQDMTDELQSLSLHDDFKVKKADINLLMEFFSPTPILPDEEEDWKRLKDIGNMFGSSDKIDAAYNRSLDAPPEIPTEDSNEKYIWIAASSYAGLETGFVQSKISEGFSLASTSEHVGAGPGGTTTFIDYYRMERSEKSEKKICGEEPFQLG